MFLFGQQYRVGDFNAGGLVEKTGAIGTFFFGFILRLLGPFGLHHIFTYHFGKQDLGLIRSKWTYGTRYSKYLLAQLGDPSVTHYFSGISRYMSGRFITMMFGD